MVGIFLTIPASKRNKEGIMALIELMEKKSPSLTILTKEEAKERRAVADKMYRDANKDRIKAQRLARRAMKVKPTSKPEIKREEKVAEAITQLRERNKHSYLLDREYYQ